jgi:hypothetical protein
VRLLYKYFKKAFYRYEDDYKDAKLEDFLKYLTENGEE